MSRTCTGLPTWPRLVRLLLVFAALSAVLLMHGMSGDHDLNATALPPVVTSDSASAAAFGGIAAAAGPSVTAGVLAPRHDHDDASAHAPAGFVAVDHAQAPPSHHDGHGHAETQACLALLTVSLVALGAMPTRARGGAASGVPPSVRRAWSSARSADVPPRTPTLSVLCLSRT